MPKFACYHTYLVPRGFASLSGVQNPLGFRWGLRDRYFPKMNVVACRRRPRRARLLGCRCLVDGMGKLS